MKKISMRWTINIVSFSLFVLLTITGLINWLLLPRGYELRESFLISLKHFLIELHQWTGLIFIIVIAVHVLLHWDYIKVRMMKSEIMQ